MKSFRADVTVMPKAGVLDIQGKAVEKTLRASGYDMVRDVRVGRIVRLCVEADDEPAACRRVEEIAGDLLANDLIESYSYSLEAAR